MRGGRFWRTNRGMTLLAVVAVAAALAGEPAIPKSDEVFFGRVVVDAPAVASEATLFVDHRPVAQRSVLGRHVTFPVRGRPRLCDVRVRWERDGNFVASAVARRAWLLRSSAGQASHRYSACRSSSFSPRKRKEWNPRCVRPPPSCSCR